MYANGPDDHADMSSAPTEHERNTGSGDCHVLSDQRNAAQKCAMTNMRNDQNHVSAKYFVNQSFIRSPFQLSKLCSEKRKHVHYCIISTDV